MTIEKDVPLSTLTTFRIGGPAAYVYSCRSVEDIQKALAFARERLLPWQVIGGGSNILARDEGYRGVLLRIVDADLSFDTMPEGTVHATASAGSDWNRLVDESCGRELWGLENLAGIPGTVGASPVQNIGAYGAEAGDAIVSVEAFDTNSLRLVRLTNEECRFAYRDSIFKQNPGLIITSVTFALSTVPTPRTEYADLQRAREQGVSLDTPRQVAEAVRDIRSRKFPDLALLGTAGSFFKNPSISREAYDALKSPYPELPGYAMESAVKVSLAWILDKALHLKGYANGLARAFENQPLVLVAERGATAREVDELASYIEEKVSDATGIRIEREVRSL